MEKSFKCAQIFKFFFDFKFFTLKRFVYWIFKLFAIFDLFKILILNSKAWFWLGVNIKYLRQFYEISWLSTEITRSLHVLIKENSEHFWCFTGTERKTIVLRKSYTFTFVKAQQAEEVQEQEKHLFSFHGTNHDLNVMVISINKKYETFLIISVRNIISNSY